MEVTKNTSQIIRLPEPPSGGKGAVFTGHQSLMISLWMKQNTSQIIRLPEPPFGGQGGCFNRR